MEPMWRTHGEQHSPVGSVIVARRRLVVDDETVERRRGLRGDIGGVVAADVTGSQLRTFSQL
jgi:hypothetical protein